MKRNQPLFPRGGPTRGALILIVLLAAGVVIAIGLQQAFYQRDRDQRDACYQRWGQEVIETLQARGEATKPVDAATKAATIASTRRDAAIDQVLSVVIDLRSVPPKATTRDLDRTLAKFAEARDALDTARAAVVKAQGEIEKTRAENPFPRLGCK